MLVTAHCRWSHWSHGTGLITKSCYINSLARLKESKHKCNAMLNDFLVGHKMDSLVNSRHQIKMRSILDTKYLINE